MALKEHCVYCFDSIIAHLERSKPPVPSFPNLE